MGIPLVIAVSGTSAWLAFLFATLGVLLVAANVNVFARDSASPGSLYGFVYEELGYWAGFLTGWSLLIAYVGMASAVTGGIVQYTHSLLSRRPPQVVESIALIVLSVIGAAALAYRNVELSARLMLWVECASVAAIVLLFVFPSHADKLAWDPDQFKLSTFRITPISAGLVLATFSFVGFESATALGAEAESPLRTIPRAMLGTVLLSGGFFVLSAYAEVAGFGGKLGLLASSGAPLQMLADLKGLAWVAPIISLGALVSFFACTLASITAAARIALLMSTHGLIPRYLSRAHDRHRTPHRAVVASSVATVALAVLLTIWHVSAFHLYGWLGTVATYGFITAYVLLVVAAPIRLFRNHELSLWKVVISGVALLFLIGALVGSLNTGASGPGKWLAPIYVVVLLLGCVYKALGQRA
jgi:amino acid transporter